MPTESDAEPAPSLGELETEVLRLLWQHGAATAESVRTWLDRPLKESTVRTVLRRLEEKGFVNHATDGRTFIYSTTTTAAAVAERGVRGIANSLYDGSMSDLLVGLVGSSRLDRAELDQLAALIERARRERS